MAEQKEAANLLLQTGQVPLSVGPAGEWVYALVTPFPTPPDGFTFSELKAAWDDKASGYFAEKPLLMTQDTRSALDSWWGPSKSTSVKVVDESALLDTAWKAQPSWAIIPFEDISPRWKVLRIDGTSPLDKTFTTYPLSYRLAFTGEVQAKLLVEFQDQSAQSAASAIIACARDTCRPPKNGTIWPSCWSLTLPKAWEQ